MPYPDVMPRHPRADYIRPPDRIARRTTAKARGWRAGWPDDCPGASARVRVTSIRPSDGRTFGVSVDRRLGELIGVFLDSAQMLGHELYGASEPSANGRMQGGVGSFVCRAIKGSNPPRPSNHSTGTALDLWSRANPQIWGNPARFVSTINPEVVELAAAADLYWGGWYWDSSRSYVDAMHFEYMARPGDVAASIKRLRAMYATIRARHNPDTPTPPPEEPSMTAEQVRELQAVLNTVGTTPALVVDGVYGELTEAAVNELPTLVARQVDTAEAAAEQATKAEAIEAVSNI